MTRACRSIFVIVLVGAAACGGTQVVQPISPIGPTVIDKISGDNQVGKVTLKLGQPLTARAYIDTSKGLRAARLSLVPIGRASSSDTNVVFNLGIPLKDRDVSFVVPTPGYGSPYSNVEKTDSLGVVKQLWIAGTKAGCSTMEARVVDQTTGAPTVYATFTACFDAGPVAYVNMSNLDTTVTVNVPVNAASWVRGAYDRYDNQNTKYIPRHVRVNSNPLLTDAVPVAGHTFVPRLGDREVILYFDDYPYPRRIKVVEAVQP